VATIPLVLENFPHSLPKALINRSLKIYDHHYDAAHSRNASLAHRGHGTRHFSTGLTRNGTARRYSHRQPSWRHLGHLCHVWNKSRRLRRRMVLPRGPSLHAWTAAPHVQRPFARLLKRKNWRRCECSVFRKGILKPTEPEWQWNCGSKELHATYRSRRRHVGAQRPRHGWGSSWSMLIGILLAVVGLQTISSSSNCIQLRQTAFKIGRFKPNISYPIMISD